MCWEGHLSRVAGDREAYDADGLCTGLVPCDGLTCVREPIVVLQIVALAADEFAIRKKAHAAAWASKFRRPDDPRD